MWFKLVISNVACGSVQVVTGVFMTAYLFVDRVGSNGVGIVLEARTDDGETHALAPQVQPPSTDWDINSEWSWSSGHYVVTGGTSWGADNVVQMSPLTISPSGEGVNLYLSTGARAALVASKSDTSIIGNVFDGGFDTRTASYTATTTLTAVSGPPLPPASPRFAAPTVLWAAAGGAAAAAAAFLVLAAFMQSRTSRKTVG